MYMLTTIQDFATTLEAIKNQNLTFFLEKRPHPSSTLFPYTTLFRSLRRHGRVACHRRDRDPPPDRGPRAAGAGGGGRRRRPDRKSTRLNSSHTVISYAVLCLKKKRKCSQ